MRGIIIALICSALLWEQGTSMSCLSCTGSEDPGLCGTIVDCPADKGCFIHEISPPDGNTTFDTGCALNNECDVASGNNQIIIGKRDGPVIKAACCHTDGCNEDRDLVNVKPQSGCFDRNPYVCKQDDVCSDPDAAQDCQLTCNICGTGGSGKQFFVEFSKMDGNPGGHIELLIVGTSVGNATISVPYLNIHKEIPIKFGLQRFNISNAIIPSNLHIEKKGVEILSSVPINIFAINYEGFNEDGFAVIPANHLSTHYFVPGTVGEHEMVVLSPYDGNNVTIHLRLNRGAIYYNGRRYQNGDVINVQLNEMETFEINTGSDISGSSVVSEKPVSIVSGDRCTHLDGVGCDHMLDMIPPVETYTKAVIVPNLAGRRNSTVQIIAAHPDTIVDVVSKSGTYNFQMNPSDHKDLIIDGAATIVSNKGILVTQFVHACCPPVYHEPFMMVLPGVDRYLSKYDFAVFDDSSNFQNHITIVIPQDQFRGLRLNGSPLHSSQTQPNLSFRGINYGVYDIPMSSGAHHLEHIDGKKFGLFIHGNRYSNGYGYSAGMDYSII